MDRLAFLTVVLKCCLMVHALPIVDPGLFVIMGVQTCREGKGYCLLGQDCSLDDDFLADDKGGHCDGLRSGFTPRASFICCRFSQDTTTTDSPLTTTDMSIDTEDTTIALNLKTDNNKEENTSPKRTTVRSYEVYEPNSEIAQHSEYEERNKSSRLDTTNEEKDEPLYVKLNIDEFIENKVKKPNNNTSQLKKKHRLDNESEEHENLTGGLTNTPGSVSNSTVSKESITSEPVVCISQPRKLGERGPLTFPTCVPLSSSTVPTSSNPDIDNQVRSSSEDSSKDSVRLGTELYVENRTGIKELENNDVSSVTTYDGLTNPNIINGSTYNLTMGVTSDKDKKSMRSDSNSGDFDDTINNIYNLLTSLNVKTNTYSKQNVSESTTVESVTIQGASTKTVPHEDNGDLINDSLMDETTTEYIPEYDEDDERPDNGYRDISSISVNQDNDSTTEEYSDGKTTTQFIPFNEGSTIPLTSVTSTDDKLNTNTVSTTQTAFVRSTELTAQITFTKSQGTSVSSTMTTSLPSKLQTTTTKTILSSTLPSSTTLGTNVSPFNIKSSTAKPQGTTTYVSTVESSTSPFVYKPTVPSLNKTTAESPTFSSESAATNVGMGTTVTTDHNDLETTSGDKYTTSGYQDEPSNTLPDDMTTVHGDADGVNDRDSSNTRVCIGKRQVTAGDDCWLVQFQDARTSAAVCPGALLTADMIITSADCAIRLYNVGMEYISVMFAGNNQSSQRIRDVIVHENYRTSNSQPARYDMGLIRLTLPHQRRQQICVVCVAEPDMDVNIQRCHAVHHNTTEEENKDSEECKHTVPTGSKPGSLIAMCSTASPSTKKVPSGSPLICNGMLAGVASSWDRGQAFTPVNLFTTWIKNNQLSW